MNPVISAAHFAVGTPIGVLHAFRKRGFVSKGSSTKSSVFFSHNLIALRRLFVVPQSNTLLCGYGIEAFGKFLLRMLPEFSMAHFTLTILAKFLYLLGDGWSLPWAASVEYVNFFVQSQKPPSPETCGQLGQCSCQKGRRLGQL